MSGPQAIIKKSPENVILAPKAVCEDMEINSVENNQVKILHIYGLPSSADEEHDEEC